MEFRTITVTRKDKNGNTVTYQESRYVHTEEELEIKKRRRIEHAKRERMRLNAPNIPSATVNDIVNAFEDLCGTLEWD